MGKTAKPKLGMDIPEALRKALLAAAQDNKISCAAAWRVAEDGDWDRQFVGRAIDELGLKVCRCQIGCF